MTANSLIAEISSYYKAYADAFHARSGTQIADFYCTPCISMRGDASIHCFQSRPETEKFFQGVADTYYEEGLRRSEIKNLEVVSIVSVRSGPSFPVEAAPLTMVSTTNGSGHHETREP
jgi:ketosteroid isomerase-like protein